MTSLMIELRLVGVELLIQGGDLRHRWLVASGMIAGRGSTTAVSNLPADPGLARTARAQRTIQERGNPYAAP